MQWSAKQADVLGERDEEFFWIAVCAFIAIKPGGDAERQGYGWNRPEI